MIAKQTFAFICVLFLFFTPSAKTEKKVNLKDRHTKFTSALLVEKERFAELMKK